MKLGRFPLVYKNYKAAYFRINKVATQSLAAIFNKSMGDGVPGGDIGPRFFKFAFVRNPYDRLVSCWLNQIANPSSFSRKLFKDGMHRTFWEYPGLKPGMAFKDFVGVVAETKDFTSNPHFKSQYLFLTDKDSGEFMPDFVGRFECLDRDYQFVCKTIGIKPLPLPVNNKTTKRTRWGDYYDRPTMQIVNERYKTDFELFGYPRFGGVQ